MSSRLRVAVVGLGIQGRKRMAIAGNDVVATVDPVISDAQYRSIEQVPVDRFDAALVCTPDEAKLPVLRYLLARGKHALVEKPLLAADSHDIRELIDLVRSHGATCYTAYNHRFEPHLATLKSVLEAGTIGPVHLLRMFYGNGTARDVRSSSWRDHGAGVLPDLGSHLLDITAFLLGRVGKRFHAWSFNRFENQAFDHVLFGAQGKPCIELEGTLLSWRNTFTLDVIGELGSAHVHGLCKWGPSVLTIRKRILPSGKPTEDSSTLECPDPTWAAEYAHFTSLCRTGGTNLEHDVWINDVLNSLVSATAATGARQSEPMGALR